MAEHSSRKMLVEELLNREPLKLLRACLSLFGLRDRFPRSSFSGDTVARARIQFLDRLHGLVRKHINGNWTVEIDTVGPIGIKVQRLRFYILR